ncbi:MAG: thiamine pyrophosphate-binding protein [Ktedonobacteraceae bacterium]|nr:thiamine pyrophosphate-binding protein [Ktedonobacteraceae bacterium]
MKDRQYLTGAQAIIQTLRTFHINTVFGIPGVHTLPLYDVMREERGFRHILARHEQGAGFMAEGYARITGSPGVVFTITGPGATNVATPVASAYADSIPLLVISSSAPTTSKGRAPGALHEVKDQFGVMQALAGWTRAIEHVEEIPSALYDAFRAIQIGRPRGAYLQVPADLLEASAEVELPDAFVVEPMRPSKDTITDAAHLLRTAQHPLILAGTGVTAARANTLLRDLAERLQAPVLLGSKSHDVLASDHPLMVPAAGPLSPDLRALIAQSDVALVVGSKLGAERTGDERLQLPANVIQIDIDPAEIGRNYPVTVGVVADAQLALTALLEALHDLPTKRARTDEITRTRETAYRNIRTQYGERVALLDSIREGLPRDGIVVADMTMLGYASAQYLPVYEPRTFIHPSELCTIGCGLPLALGAKVAAPTRPVVALCGDDGFLLNSSELATAVQEQIPVVVVIFNDATLTAVKTEQQRRFSGRYFSTDVRPPDYVALARAFHAEGIRAENPDALRDALSIAIYRNGPTVIEVPLPAWEW